jgi:hypothetical protein
MLCTTAPSPAPPVDCWDPMSYEVDMIWAGPPCSTTTSPHTLSDPMFESVGFNIEVGTA